MYFQFVIYRNFLKVVNLLLISNRLNGKRSVQSIVGVIKKDIRFLERSLLGFQTQQRAFVVVYLFLKICYTFNLSFYLLIY